MIRQRVVAIVGPTGSGKARLAVAVARQLDADLLSCDSMKVYRGMDVGTAKPTPEAREGVRWHGLDVVDPWETFDANRFKTLFEEVRTHAKAEGRPLLLSGGSMLYLKAATEGLGDAPPRDADLRERLRLEAEELGSPVLHARLRTVDPEAAERIHPNDLRRIVRALEVHSLTGRPMTSFQGQFASPRDDLDRVVCVVERDREDMDQQIDARVDRMLEQGWIEECRALKALERPISREAAQAIGYRQILEWIETGGKAPLGELATRIKTATRRLARKQLTWIRHLKECHTLRVEPGESPGVHAECVLNLLS